jgi:hypothetical protein
MQFASGKPLRRPFFAPWLALALVLVASVAWSQPRMSRDDPPLRVGVLTDIEGSVVWAPAGQTEWKDAPRNRPVTRGDRLWTDDGARAEVHFGSSVLRMDSGTFVEAVAVEGDELRLQLNEGVADARVRELLPGDTFEIATPQLALRATQAGDWRIDVDPGRGFTRVAVRSGVITVRGASGSALRLVAGQTIAFSGSDLAPFSGKRELAEEDFDRWAAERDRAEDQSIAARYVSRDVVGYQELDRHGAWSQDAVHGPVWYPDIAAGDWAPYRYGRWEWIAPWGWTWIDDAPWGFAPLHYGRWATIGARWCWVPGPLGSRAVYAPALVSFMGSGASVAWYPLAPGEVWRPLFDASPGYVRDANRYLVTDSRGYNTGTPFFLQRPDAITAMRVDDFDRGVSVQTSRTRVSGAELARMQPIVPPTRRHAQNLLQ